MIAAPHVSELLELIAADELEVAVERLIGLLKGSAPDLLNGAIVYSAQIARMGRQERAGLLLPAEAARSRAQIAAGLASFIQELPSRLALRAGRLVAGDHVLLRDDVRNVAPAAQAVGGRLLPQVPAPVAPAVAAPRVFLSYAHEGPEYGLLVARLAARLRADGLDARLDQWHLDGRPFHDFMASEIRNADKVLMLCSPRYREGVHQMQDGEAASGRGWEAMLIGSALLADYEFRRKLVIVVTRDSARESVPWSLVGWKHFELLLADAVPFDEGAYASILRELLAGADDAPAIGPRAPVESKEIAPLRGSAKGSPDTEGG